MGVTYTTNYNLIRPNPFEEEDAWAALLNTNLTSIDTILFGKLTSTAAVASVAGLTPAADRLPYYTSGTAATVTPFTAFARTLIDDADAATMRSTLGLGSVSTLNSVSLTTNVTGILPVANGGTGGNTAAAARTALSVPAISDLAAYAPLASPGLTGTPTAPTAAVDTNTTQLATTAYVVGQGYLKSSTASTTYQTALGFTPVQQGGGTSQLSNKVYIGWDNANLRVQVDSTDFGASWPINISGSAAAPSSAAVLGATAAAAVGAVGTYAFLRSVASTAYNQGDTVAGSLLSYTNGNGGGGNPSPAGSWRLMGSTGTQTNSALASLWLRYA